MTAGHLRKSARVLGRVALLFAALSFVGCATRMVPDTLAPAAAGQFDPVRRDYVDSRVGQIHLRKVEPGKVTDAKAPVMALHLSPNSSQVFSAFLPLIGQDRRAVAPDYPGYGMSDPIPGTQRIEDYASSMWEVADALNLGLPIDLIGYHTGSAVALEMTRQRPQAVRRIVLVAVPVLTDEERAGGAAIPYIAYDEEGEFAREEWQRSWRWRGPGQTVESVYATFAEKMRPGVRERGAHAVLSYDVVPSLKAARQPIMIVRVNDDLWEATARARSIRPDAHWVELPEFGHGLFHVAPDAMNALVREFLDQ
ncbi:MAG: alpha/beta hydrolase [Woeseiaceae bacterium]|nr:alpha/beta hydrolase [Woeseiaceae bacterium]